MIHCSFDGRLTRNAEIKTVNGKSLMVFDVATNHGYGDKKKTIYIRCNMWERSSGSIEKIANSMTKGLFVMIHGTMYENEYKDKTGNNHKSLECSVSDLNRIGLMFDKPKQQSAPAAVSENQVVHEDNDIPF